MKNSQFLLITFSLQVLVSIFILSGCASTGSNQELSVRGLFDRHIENSFGKDGLKNHTSITQKGKVIVEDFGIESPFLMQQMAPQNILMKTEMMGSAVSSGCNPELCWNQQPGQGVRILDGTQKSQIMRQADFHFFENVEKHYVALVIEAPAEGSTSKNHKVVATTKEGSADQYYFSKESGLLIGAILQMNAGQGMESVRISYNKYKAFGDMKMPSEIIQAMSVATMKMIIDDVNYEPLTQETFSLEE